MINSYSTVSQAVNVNGTINFDTTRILTGCTIKHADGTPTFTLTKPGYYFITFDGVISGTIAGIVTVELLNGADAVPAALASTTIAIGNEATLNFTTIIRVLPSCPSIDNTTKLSIANTGVATTFTNVNINITKLC